MKTDNSLAITVLGCGDAFGNEGRFNTSFLLSHKEESLLLDCGASTLIRLKQEKVDLESISTIILSHFHGDHFGGVPFFLISSLFESPRKSPLTIVGPAGVEDRVKNLQEAMYPGTSGELEKLDLQFIEFKQDIAIMVGAIEIEAFPVNHSPLATPHGFRVRWQGKTIGFSGDTSWSDNLIKIADETDMFICECNFVSQRSPGHLCFEELLEKKHLLNSSKIYLTHMSSEMVNGSQVDFLKLSDGQKIHLS